jgi:hypothetical protein
MLHEPSARLIRTLESTGRRRISLAQLREEFAKACPELAEQPDRRSHLAGLIQRAAEAGAIKLPSGSKAWDRTGVSLPAFIVLTARQPVRPAIVAPNYGWHPLLAFAANERHPRGLAEQKIITEGLTGEPYRTLSVPIKERSLEIFGEEKRLDQLRAGPSGLFDNRLNLTDLGCRICPIPLPYEAGPAAAHGKPILILENNDTWSSFCEWNRTASQFSAVAYAGGGNAKGLAYDETFIDELLDRHAATELLYFGDLDPAGLRIAAGAARRRVARGGVPLAPCVSLYRWLLEHGRRTPLVSRERAVIGDLAWLPSELQIAVELLFNANQRIPQESLGTCILSRIDITFWRP